MLRWVYLVYQVYLFIARPLTFGVRVMLVRDGQVLLVRHTYVPGWFMPGGGVRRGETLDAAARREAAEEVGAELRDLHLVGAYTNFKELKSDHNILFLSTDFTVGRKQDSEIAEARFFPLDALPEGLWPGHRRRLEELLARQDSPQYGEW
ncbi:MAG TPA: NUDIX domain-containing protein [Anaerolineales bacterium]|nr:NUDIX domain-containing protein [Anaerolineales bacterium]